MVDVDLVDVNDDEVNVNDLDVGVPPLTRHWVVAAAAGCR
jgi:hypothetical protein